MLSINLETLAKSIQLEESGNFELAMRFGLDCVARVSYLLTDERMRTLLQIGLSFIHGDATKAELHAAATEAAARARSHQGSGGIDGSGNAAVSVSFGVAAALSGRALQAAEYAAYAAVYAYSSSAVADPEAYESEHRWQFNHLLKLTS